MTYPAMCPLCNCPIQLLCEGQHPKGTIDDAMAAHCRVVHPEQQEVNPA